MGNPVECYLCVVILREKDGYGESPHVKKN